MPLPPDALRLPETLDPFDIEKYTVTISKAGVTQATYPILDANENVAEYSLGLTAEAIAVGLRILDESPYYTTLSGLLVNFALSVDESMQNLPIFTKGIEVGIELTVLSDAIAPRRKQRTLAVKVMQR